MSPESFWPNIPKWIVVERIRVTRAEFEEMRTGSKPDNLPAPPYTLCKVKIDGRWHACDRQYSCGQAMHFARPIVLVCPATEAGVGAATPRQSSTVEAR